MYVDLSRTITNGMPAFRLKNEDGTITKFEVNIQPLLTRQQTKPKFTNDVSFEITQVTMQCVVGTYIDSPFHRYENMPNISDLAISDLIGDGIVIDARGLSAWDCFDDYDKIHAALENKFVLFCFGWDSKFGTEEYHSYPYLSESIIKKLIEFKPKGVGIDTVNIDNSNDLARPAHSQLLREKILIIENLINLDKLIGKQFRFFAPVLKIEKGASFPVRAFAEISE